MIRLNRELGVLNKSRARIKKVMPRSVSGGMSIKIIFPERLSFLIVMNK